MRTVYLYSVELQKQEQDLVLHGHPLGSGSCSRICPLRQGSAAQFRPIDREFYKEVKERAKPDLRAN